MSVEELLKPRIEILSKYPFSPFHVGQIFVMTRYNEQTEWFFNYDKMNWRDSFISDYPNIFRNMNWWEKRHFVDMPIYAKSGDGEIFKAEYTSTNMVYIKPNIKSQGGIKYLSVEDFTPSTEQEYNEYIKLTTPS